MIIYGRTSFRKVLGQIRSSKCKACSITDVYSLVRNRRWFTLFFIPVIPYKSEYFLICNNCKRGFKIPNSDANELITSLKNVSKEPALEV